MILWVESRQWQKVSEDRGEGSLLLIFIDLCEKTRSNNCAILTLKYFKTIPATPSLGAKQAKLGLFTLNMSVSSVVTHHLVLSHPTHRRVTWACLNIVFLKRHISPRAKQTLKKWFCAYISAWKKKYIQFFIYFTGYTFPKLIAVVCAFWKPSLYCLFIH